MAYHRVLGAAGWLLLFFPATYFMSDTSVKQLLSRAKLGESDGLGELLKVYHNYLTVLATTQLGGRLRRRMSPSDVVQETMLAAHRDIQDFKGVSEREFLGWLRQVLLNTIHHAVEKHLKAQRRDIRREVSFEQLGNGVERSKLAFADLFADRGPSPSEPVRRRELAVEIADQLAKLRPDYRDVIVLRNLQGMPFEEVAMRMERSPGAVRMLWLRAIEKLKQVYEVDTQVGS